MGASNGEDGDGGATPPSDRTTTANQDDQGGHAGGLEYDDVDWVRFGWDLADWTTAIQHIADGFRLLEVCNPIARPDRQTQFSQRFPEIDRLLERALETYQTRIRPRLKLLVKDVPDPPSWLGF